MVGDQGAGRVAVGALHRLDVEVHIMILTEVDEGRETLGVGQIKITDSKQVGHVFLHLM